jgi:DNA-binding Lrp family transcriptional regulator
VIERLLSEIRAGGSTTPALLAKKLNTSVEMVTAMLERLAQMGLIENFAPNCADTACQGCSLGSYCQKPARPGGQVWELKKPQTP